MDLLTRLDLEVGARRESGVLADALHRWRARHEELRRYDHPDALISLARGLDPECQESKNLVLAALAVEGVGGDDDAAVLLVWLMLPALLLVRQRLGARSELDAGDLDAELLAGLWEAAARVRLGAPYVAKRLVDGARHRAFAAIRREEDWTGRVALFEGEIGELQTGKTDADEVPDLLSEAVAAGVISDVDAQLFRASRSAIPRLRQRLGISESAVRSRRLRAKRRLLDWLPVSSPLASLGRPAGSPQEVPTDSIGLRATDRAKPPPL